MSIKDLLDALRGANITVNINHGRDQYNGPTQVNHHYAPKRREPERHYCTICGRELRSELNWRAGFHPQCALAQARASAYQAISPPDSPEEELLVIEPSAESRLPVDPIIYADFSLLEYDYDAIESVRRELRGRLT